MQNKRICKYWELEARSEIKVTKIKVWSHQEKTVMNCMLVLYSRQSMS